MLQRWKPTLILVRVHPHSVWVNLLFDFNSLWTRLPFLCLRKLSQVSMCVILLVLIVLRNHHMITSIRYWSRVNIQMDTFRTLWSWDPSLFLHYKFLLHFMSIIPDCLTTMISVLNFPSSVFSSQIYDITKVLIILTKSCNK